MKVLLTIHILCAVLWVGGAATLHALARRAIASGDRQRMLSTSQEADVMGTRFFAPLAGVLLIAGILLVSKIGAQQSDVFVQVGYTGWFVSFLIGAVYYSRAAKQRDDIVARDGLDSPAFLAHIRKVANVATLELTVLLVVIVFMATKPGL